MNIVTNYEATGHSGSFSATSGIYTVAGDLTTDAENDIITMKGNVTITASSAKVATFNFYFIDDNNSNQDAIVAAIKAVRSAIDEDLNS